MAAQEYYNPGSTAPPPGSPYTGPQSNPAFVQNGYPQGPPPPYQALASGPPPPPPPPPPQQQHPDSKPAQGYPPQQPYYTPQRPNNGPQDQQYFQPQQYPPPAETGSLQRPGSSGYSNGNQQYSSSPQQHPYSSSPQQQPYSSSPQSRPYLSPQTRPHSASPHPNPRRDSTPHSRVSFQTDSRSRSRSRSRDRDGGRGHSSSRPRHSHRQDSGSGKSKSKSRGGAFETFVGAGGGAVVGDLIFPGLGTVGGAILGGLGGNKVAKDKRSKSHSGYRDRYDREWAEGSDGEREGRRRH